MLSRQGGMARDFSRPRKLGKRGDREEDSAAGRCNSIRGEANRLNPPRRSGVIGYNARTSGGK